MELNCIQGYPRGRHKTASSKCSVEALKIEHLFGNGWEEKVCINVPRLSINSHNKTTCLRCCQSPANYVCPQCRDTYFCHNCYQLMHNSSKPWLHNPTIIGGEKSINKAMALNSKPNNALTFDKLNRIQRDYVNKNNTICKQNKKVKQAQDITQLFKRLNLAFMANAKNYQLKQHSIKQRWNAIKKGIQKNIQLLHQMLQTTLNLTIQQINSRCQQEIKLNCKNYFTTEEIFQIQKNVKILQNRTNKFQITCQEYLVQKINKFLKKQSEQMKNTRKISEQLTISAPTQMFQGIKNYIKLIDPKHILPPIQTSKLKQQRILGDFQNVQYFQQSKCKTARKVTDKNKSFLYPTRHTAKRRRSKDFYNNLNISTFSLNGQQEGLQMKKIKSETTLPIQISDCRILKIEKKNRIGEGTTKKLN